MEKVITGKLKTEEKQKNMFSWVYNIINQSSLNVAMYSWNIFSLVKWDETQPGLKTLHVVCP